MSTSWRGSQLGKCWRGPAASSGRVASRIPAASRAARATTPLRSFLHSISGVPGRRPLHRPGIALYPVCVPGPGLRTPVRLRSGGTCPRRGSLPAILALLASLWQVGNRSPRSIKALATPGAASGKTRPGAAGLGRSRKANDPDASSA